MWSLGNEPDTENFPESAYKYWHSLYELAHETDPSDHPGTLGLVLPSMAAQHCVQTGILSFSNFLPNSQNCKRRPLGFACCALTLSRKPVIPKIGNGIKAFEIGALRYF